MGLCRHARRPFQMILAAGQGSSCAKNYYSTRAYKATLGEFSVFRHQDNVQFWASDVCAGIQLVSGSHKAVEGTDWCFPQRDIKAALVDCNWDIEAALTDFRKGVNILAARKSGRAAAASEGLLALAQSETKAAIIELTCETDFAGSNDIGLSFSKASFAGSKYSTSQQMKVNLEHLEIRGETTIQSAVTEVAAMVGENVKLRRGFVIPTSSPNVLSMYLHGNPQPGLGRVAGFLSLELEDGNAKLEALRRVGSELAMHVVTAKPLFLTKELVSSDALDKERALLKSQAESSGKSEMEVENMVEGGLRKYYEEVVLVEQKFVLNSALNIQTLLKNLSEEVGTSVKIGNFFRMEVGEEIENVKTLLFIL